MEIIKDIQLITNSNFQIYLNLVNPYEAEFSELTGKLPNEHGLFEPDTFPHFPYVGYLLFKKHTPIGFCIIEIQQDLNDIAEFYIIPAMRNNNYGYCFATLIFELHPGKWQVRQIKGADKAKAFWQKVIGKYTNNNFIEKLVEDLDWGIVTKQEFTVIANNKLEKENYLHDTI